MKNLIISAILVGFTIVTSKVACARVTGPCSDCHTMHNSQQGAPLAMDFDGNTFSPTDVPNPTLLVKDCIGCHTNTQEETIVDGVPMVFNVGGTDEALAGGNFWFLTDNDANGHNVYGIDMEGSSAMFPPPGDRNNTGITQTGVSALACAGTYGCHGQRNVDNEFDAVKGAHHANDTLGIDGSSVGLSYRFLDGILGLEDPDWEQDDSINSHNEYKGATSNTLDTMSYLCAECHGDYHAESAPGEVGTGSPWFRHPTDVVLTNDGEYAEYTTYSMVAPVARPNPGGGGVQSQVTPGTDIVMCLSCHRAHASPYYKIMRWDYRGWPASDTNGCAVCHTWKD